MKTRMKLAIIESVWSSGLNLSSGNILSTDSTSFEIITMEPVHESSNNVVWATSKASDQRAHTRSPQELVTNFFHEKVGVCICKHRPTFSILRVCDKFLWRSLIRAFGRRFNIL